MKRFLPIVLVVLILSGAGYFLLKDDNKEDKNILKESFSFGEFNKRKSCSRLPMFLYKAGIKRPMIDLSQNKYKGIAFYFGQNFSNVLHKKEWEKYDYMGTYSIDNMGNIYLAPNPFISIKATTFNLQKAIYKMDSQNGNLQRWLVIDEIAPNQNNPYGIISLVYDCDDNTLWASAIDKSNYKGSRGRIYHINPKTKKILQKVEGFDALTLAIIHTNKHKLLLAGNARDNSLYAFVFKNSKISNGAKKVLTLPNPNLHIRKVKVIGKNSLKIEAIKFNYSLVAETTKKVRFVYIATYNPSTNSWSIIEK